MECCSVASAEAVLALRRPASVGNVGLKSPMIVNIVKNVELNYLKIPMIWIS